MDIVSEIPKYIALVLTMITYGYTAQHANNLNVKEIPTRKGIFLIVLMMVFIFVVPAGQIWIAR